MKSGSSLPRSPIEVDQDIQNGSVTADKTEACIGEVVTLTVTPANGYVLRSLTVTDSAGNPVAVTNNKFTMPGRGVSVTAEFAPMQEYRIEYYEVANGSIGREGEYDDSYQAFPGETVTVKTVPYSRCGTVQFTVMAWDEYSLGYTLEIPGVSRPDPNTLVFTMPAADVKVFAEIAELRYEGKYLIFSWPMEGGTVLANITTAAEGETVTLTVRPDNGYAYVSGSLEVWMVDEDGTMLYDMADYGDVHEAEGDGQYWFEMPGDMIYILAEFEQLPDQEKYYVFVDEDIEDGSLSVDCELASPGWIVTVTASPATNLCYDLETLTVTDADGKTIDTSSIGSGKYEFRMPASPVMVTGTFAIPVRGITAVTLTEPENGTTNSYIIVSEESEVGFSVDITTVLMPEDELKELTVKGDVSGNTIPVTEGSHNEGSSVYHSSFTMPSEPVTVTACFGKKSIRSPRMKACPARCLWR